MQHWRTTLAGLTTIISSAVTLIFAIINHNTNEAVWTTSLISIVTGLGLMFASDAGQTERIKEAVVSGDTTMLTKPNGPKPTTP